MGCLLGGARSRARGSVVAAQKIWEKLLKFDADFHAYLACPIEGPAVVVQWD